MDNYPNTIIISYKSLTIPDKLIINNLSAVSVNKSIASKSEIKKIISFKYLVDNIKYKK